MPRLSWKKVKNRGHVTGCGFDLNYGGRTYAHVRALPGGLWYWYGFDWNTAPNPALSYRDAQQHCLSIAKAKLEKLKEDFSRAD